MSTRLEGDDYLSSNDRRLWELCYSTLMRFGCVTIFKVRGPDVRIRLNRQIMFFVPGNHPQAAAVKAYLEEELRPEIMLPEEADGHWMWGTTVQVVYFSGLEGYLTNEETEPMIEKAVAGFMRTIEAYKRKPS